MTTNDQPESILTYSLADHEIENLNYTYSPKTIRFSKKKGKGSTNKNWILQQSFDGPSVYNNIFVYFQHERY